MSNATYCTEEKKKSCEHWDAKNKKCPYRRPCEQGETPTCFIGGIEKDYEKEKKDETVAVHRDWEFGL